MLYGNIATRFDGGNSHQDVLHIFCVFKAEFGAWSSALLSELESVLQYAVEELCFTVA